MQSKAAIARALARAFVAGRLEVDRMVEHGAELLGRRWRWLRPLARRLVDAFDEWPRPRERDVTGFILADDGFLRACERHDLRLKQRLPPRPEMTPVPAAESWNLPSICTTAELAEGLGITIPELDWFADQRALEAKQNCGRLRHYHYRTLAKRFGHVRLVEAPKRRLKDIQRSILTDIVDRIPAHAAAHGFRAGRSIKTFAALHVGKRVVLRIDLEDFFPSISAARIRAIFRTAGYSEAVADFLAGLCTNTAPRDVWDDLPEPMLRRMHHRRRLYSQPHLPQGAPTSPALANLAADWLDRRLACLAQSAGAAYTRYADDLVFSGDREFERVVARFQLHACATALEEGFSVHHRKTRIMRQGVCQRVAGMVVNRRINVIRSDYDRLKATLNNCIRLGAAGQNRKAHHEFRAHLLGRVAFVEMINPPRGRRLRELFDRIEW